MASQPGPPRVANLNAGRIALGYIVIGLVWIFGSGFALELPILKEVAGPVEIFKGTGFVLVTALGLYILLARRSRVIAAAQRELISVNEQRARLVAAVEQSAEAIVITDTVPDITYVNPAFERVSGYSQPELIGYNPRIVKSDQHGPEFWQDLWATLLRGETWHGRFVNRSKDGSLYEADSVITPVRDRAGTIVSYVGVQHDTTRERALERHLAESGRLEAIGQVAGGIAHDFNNLLTVISGHAQLLSAGTGLDSEARDDVGQILRASGSAAILVSQLLAFARRQVLQPAVVDLAPMVAQLRPMLEGLLGPSITLRMETTASAGTVFADAGQLEQVIINLAVNARDAMPAGGTFTMTLSELEIDRATDAPAPIKPGRYALLVAADTGSGMDEATRSRVFEPFFTTKGPGRGTGLGLATAYGIVNQSGGHLSVESEPGCGSTFTVYLPHHGGPRLDPPARQSPTVSRGTETILLVEDQEPVRAVISRTLSGLGYTVQVAANADEALHMAAGAAPSLLITDVHLPGLDGPGLAAQVTAAHPGVAVLFVSGSAGETMVDAGVLGEDAAFLAKPFTSDDLGRKVRELLDHRP
jgi:two-component system, cell cycle sensor histidine kinase and response regulator CckA